MIGKYSVPTYIFGMIKPRSPVLLYLHGNGTSCERQIELVAQLHHRLNMPIVFPEYSGHGRNERLQYADVTLKDTVLETCSIYEWLKGQVGEENIAIYGSSYGGHVAAKLMGEYQPAKVALQAPSILPQVEDGINMGELFKVEQRRLFEPSVDAVVTIIRKIAASYSGPLLIIRSGNDELVSRELVEVWNSVFPRAKMTSIKDAKHSIRKSNLVVREQWISELKDFFGDF